jgi:hypothetical protein
MKLPLSVLLLLIATLALSAGCASWRYAHQVDGGSVNAVDNVARKGPGADKSRTTTIRVTPPNVPSVPMTPTTHPSVAPAPTAPTTSLAPAGDPVKVVFGGQGIQAPAGSGVEFIIDEKGVQTGEEYRHDRTANGNGATLRTDSPNGTTGFTGALPDISLPKTPGESGGAGTDGGDFAASITNILPQASRVAYIFMVAGLLGLITAGVYFYITKNWAKTLIIAGIAGVLIAVGVLLDRYPWVFVLALLAGAAGLALWFYIHRRDQALTAVVAGVENAPADAASAVKNAIADAGGSVPAVKAVISAIKDAL